MSVGIARILAIFCLPKVQKSLIIRRTAGHAETWDVILSLNAFGERVRHSGYGWDAVFDEAGISPPKKVARMSTVYVTCGLKR